jgi:hypothetical protein
MRMEVMSPVTSWLVMHTLFCPQCPCLRGTLIAPPSLPAPFPGEAGEEQGGGPRHPRDLSKW